MSPRRRATPVVVDTDAINWYLDPHLTVGPEAARTLIDERACVLSFVTVTEIRYGALLARWGGPRFRRLERSLDSFDVVPTDERLIARSTALALNLEFVAGAGIYEGVPGFDLLRVRP